MSSESLPPDRQPDKPRDSGGPCDGITTYVYDSQNQLASIDAGDGRGPVPASPRPSFSLGAHSGQAAVRTDRDGRPNTGATIPHDFWWSRSMTKPARSSLPSRTAGRSTCALCREEREGR